MSTLLLYDNYLSSPTAPYVHGRQFYCCKYDVVPFIMRFAGILLDISHAIHGELCYARVPLIPKYFPLFLKPSLFQLAEFRVWTPIFNDTITLAGASLSLVWASKASPADGSSPRLCKLSTGPRKKLIWRVNLCVGFCTLRIAC